MGGGKVSSIENCSKSPFVKINMDGIPIGRKVDLKAYNSYEKLSLGVDELFKGLVAGNLCILRCELEQWCVIVVWYLQRKRMRE